MLKVCVDSVYIFSDFGLSNEIDFFFTELKTFFACFCASRDSEPDFAFLAVRSNRRIIGFSDMIPYKNLYAGFAETGYVYVFADERAF